MAAVAQETHDALRGVSAGDLGFIESAVGLREAHMEAPGSTRARSRSSRSPR